MNRYKVRFTALDPFLVREVILYAITGAEAIRKARESSGIKWLTAEVELYWGENNAEHN